jgi:GGDEF domain-containing protein
VFPDDAGDADALMRCADAAMYRMKVTSAGGFCYFAEVVPRPPS